MSAEQPPKTSVSQYQWRSMSNSQIEKLFGFSPGTASSERPSDIPEPHEKNGKKDVVVIASDQVVEQEPTPKNVAKKKPPGDDGMPPL